MLHPVKTTGLLLLLLFSLDLFAQRAEGAEVTAVWSENFKSKRNVQSTRMIGADEVHLYVLRDELGRDGRFMLDIFDRNTMVRLHERVVFVPDIPGHTVQFDRILMLGGRLLLIVTAFDAREGLVRAFASSLGTDGIPQDVPVLLAEATTRKRGSMPFGYELSRDGSKLLVYPANPSERRVTDRYSFRVVDAALETVWDKNLDLQQSAELMEVGSFRVDARGHIYMMSGVQAPDKTLRGMERQRSDRSYVVIAYDPDENRIKEFDVAVDGKWVVATSFDLDDNGNPVIGGFYSNDRYFSIAGTFFFRINGITKQVEATGMKAFSLDFLKQFMRERDAERGQELQDFYFDHFIVREDGGAVFVAEQYYVIQRWRTDITTGRQEILHYYHYGDLLVVDVAPDGSINWTVRVPKEQVSVNDQGPFSSYAMMTDGDNIHLLFNDHPENVELLKNDPGAAPRVLSGLKRSAAALVTLNVQGDLRRQNLFRSRDSEVILRPKVWLSDRKGEVFLYAQYRKSYRFGRLRL